MAQNPCAMGIGRPRTRPGRGTLWDCRPAMPRMTGAGELAQLALPRYPLGAVLLRRLAERQQPAADGTEAGARFELDGIAERRVVEPRQPDPHRPLALALGFPGRIVEFAGDALGVDVADQQIAPGLRHAAGGGRFA